MWNVSFEASERGSSLSAPTSRTTSDRTRVVGPCAVLLLVAALSASCATTSGSKVPSTEGLKDLSLPAGWVALAADPSVGPMTVLVLKGPSDPAASPPVVEFERRELSAADQRRSAVQLLTALTAEMVQSLQSFAVHGEPASVTVGDVPGASIELEFTEVQADGPDQSRRGRFYGAVVGNRMWVIRCLDDAKGGANDAFAQIIASVRFEG